MLNWSWSLGRVQIQDGSLSVSAIPPVNITAKEDLFSAPYYCYILLGMHFHLSHANDLVPALFENTPNDVPTICWCELVKHTYMDPLSYHNPRVEVQTILRTIPQQFPPSWSPNSCSKYWHRKPLSLM